MLYVLKECLKRNEKDTIPCPISPASEYRELILKGYLEAKIFQINNKSYKGYQVTQAGKDYLKAL